MARILVVDDEYNIRMMIRLGLQHDGHTVDVAADGHESLDKYGDGAEWDLVLLDQRMPGLEGLAVLKQMRYHNPRARVIMITAFGTIDLAVDAMKAGATDFLRKPFTMETLRGAVSAALSGPGGSLPPPAEHSAITFGMTTINGFRIEFKLHSGIAAGDDMGFMFTVRNPDGESQECTVVLSAVVMELIKAHTDRDVLPGGNRFWQSVAEEALANYVYQNADFPPDGFLRVDELTGGLRRFIEAILVAA